MHIFPIIPLMYISNITDYIYNLSNMTQLNIVKRLINFILLINYSSFENILFNE